MTGPAPVAPVYVVRGSDPVLRARAADALVAELLGDDERAFAVEDVTVPPGRGRGAGDGARDDDVAEGDGTDRVAAGHGDGAADADAEAATPAGPAGAPEEVAPTGAGAVAAAAADAASTPPFMTARRVVVVRDVGNLAAAEAAPLVAYLAAPLESTVLVLVAGGGGAGRPAAGPKALGDAVRAAGGVTVGPERETTDDVLAQSLAESGIALTGEARRAVASRLGDDAARVPPLVDALVAAFGPGARLGPDDVAPYLGDAGPVAGYLLTNMIEAGDAAGALEVLDRLLRTTSARQPRPAHPLQVTAMLHGRYRRLLRLDDPEVRNADQAAARLSAYSRGKVSPGAASHALRASRALGTAGLRRAFALLHGADLDLKGASAVPPETVLEVLVVRLAALHAGATARAGARGRTRR